MEKVLSTLKLDQYYKVILVVSAFALFLSLKCPLMVSNDVVSTISVGFLLIGIGEWINHPAETTITPQYRITVRNRTNTKIGTVLDLIGLAVIGVGVFYIA
ncbi:hypothetical protein CGJ40_23265 [Vibrio parahaemolyticus]|uniref:hypothetical protein n=1 Tax=Vibrio parahaemolyticus TaxID=670 RepID=UPI001120824C|nr:hypothetical protein [Vibrio parahaemolyticus]TOE56360.1 hypothetical protein CGJ40_23265 [Vibrio parahaemolyticus]